MKIILFILLIFLLPLISSMSPQQLSQQTPYNCTSETSPLQITIIEINQTLDNTLQNLSYYKNLSEYYQDLYESKEINVTHGELIQIFNTLNQLNLNFNQTNQTLNEIKQEFTKYKFDVSVYAFGGSLVGFSIFELIIWYFWRRKKKHETST